MPAASPASPARPLPAVAPRGEHALLELLSSKRGRQLAFMLLVAAATGEVRQEVEMNGFPLLRLVKGKLHLELLEVKSSPSGVLVAAIQLCTLPVSGCRLQKRCAGQPGAYRGSAHTPGHHAGQLVGPAPLPLDSLTDCRGKGSREAAAAGGAAAAVLLGRC